MIKKLSVKDPGTTLDEIKRKANSILVEVAAKRNSLDMGLSLDGLEEVSALLSSALEKMRNA